VLVSPVILVRLLTVEEFGQYREFLLYSTVLTSIAAFGINSSLLRFIPHWPGHRWRFIEQAAVMTFGSAAVVVAAAVLLNELTAGAALGAYVWPVAAYVLLFVNLDFWEYLWLAEKRPLAVFVYTSGRLFARLAVVVTAALLSDGDVDVIIWSLVSLEAVRLAISFIAWRAQREQVRGTLAGSWREQLTFCLPFGGSLVLAILNKSIGSLFVAKLIGPVGLAHYSIGTYVQPIVTVLRNSFSDVLLPEMVEGGRRSQADTLALWRRATVVSTIFLLAAGIVLAKFADALITTVFSEVYRPAVLIFQVYLLVLIRESIDFGVPLRAINRTAPILHSNLIAIVLNGVFLAMLLPAGGGLAGAVLAFVLSRMIEGVYLGWQTLRAYEVGLSALANWGEMLRVAIAAGAAALVLYGSFWTDALGLFGVVAGGAAYVLIFTALLWLLRVRELTLLLKRLQSLRRVRAGADTVLKGGEPSSGK
jgi:O-antigen/teichoic acid export membrane protein